MTAQSAMRLLVVEDEPEILSEVAGYLRRRGELVKTASSYTQALEALGSEEEPIDMLISDVRMPDGSGLDLIRLVVGRPGNQCRCLLMTGHLEQGDLSPELESAGIQVVYKPFSLSALYRVVNASLGELRGPAPMAAA